ncbi:hypothetical protein SUGI_0684380 [Cryptomeria japonica]|nr:hypothetical protein SUGI_0684380 [Cryptomeria japonica]
MKSTGEYSRSGALQHKHAEEMLEESVLKWTPQDILNENLFAHKLPMVGNEFKYVQIPHERSREVHTRYEDGDIDDDIEAYTQEMAFWNLEAEKMIDRRWFGSAGLENRWRPRSIYVYQSQHRLVVVKVKCSIHGRNVEKEADGIAYVKSEMYGTYAFFNIEDGKEEDDEFKKRKRNIVEAAVVLHMLFKLCKGNVYFLRNR